MVGKALFVLLVVALSHFAQAYPSPASYYQAQVVGGTATQYTDWAPGGGCGYIQNPSPGYQVLTTVGTSQENFGNGELCGMCIQVNSLSPMTGNQPFYSVPYTVLLTNWGPVPSPYWLDHSTPAITNGGGRFAVNFQAVPCPVTSNVQWQINGGSNQWYLQMIPVYNSLVISQMCIVMNGQWTPMNRVGGGNGLWAAYGGQMGDNPQVKAISVDGQVIVDTIAVSLSAGVSATGIYGGYTPSNFVGMRSWALGAAPDCNAPPSVGLRPANLTAPIEGPTMPVGPASGPTNPDNALNPAQANAAPSSSDDSLSGGAIAGIVIGSFVGGVLFVALLLAIAAVIAVVVIRRRKPVVIPGAYVKVAEDSL